MMGASISQYSRLKIPVITYSAIKSFQDIVANEIICKSTCACKSPAFTDLIVRKLDGILVSSLVSIYTCEKLQLFNRK
jgi:hypothetical protein